MQADKWIKFIRQYGPIPRNDSAFEEHTLKAAKRAGFEPIYFEHPYLKEVLNCFQNENSELFSVILTGTAGDGKTHLCRKVWESLNGDLELWNSDNPYLTLSLANRGKLHIIRDLSAWVPRQGDRWDPDKSALLENFCNTILSSSGTDYFLIAANDGQLMESWKRLPDTTQINQVRNLFETLLIEDLQGIENVRLKFFNLSRSSSAKLLDNALEAFLNHPGWKFCFEGENGKRLEFGDQSPIRINYYLLSSSLVRNRLRDLFELCDYNGLHIPIREILALLVNAILGHWECKDSLMIPADVSKVITKGTINYASLYNNIFGGNLSEARRDSIGVFIYLNLFRIGYETTNRIDNILIFGEADEELKPYFDRFLGSDNFYGANTIYRAEQGRYVEGTEEDETRNEAFLQMLVAQRRALFFKIPESEAEELHLWDLSVFRYAGEYLNNVVRVLNSNKRIERAILNRIIRGLNRIITGMLVTSDRDLYLSTSHQSSGAKVARIFEENISVSPRLGESIDIIKDHSGKPVLKVSLSRSINESLSLSLIRYEFLSRVAEGALPSSFSKECYEDVLSFKSRLLSALARRRNEDGVTQDSLLFRLLKLDDNGNPSHEDIEIIPTPNSHN